MTQDIHAHADLDFPTSLPAFQQLFPDDAACAAYLEKIRWEHGFICPWCAKADEPYRFANRPGVLRCKACKKNIGLTAGTVMERTHTPLSVWFWGAYLVASLTPGMSATQFQRQLGLTRYETAFQILHKLRAGMVRPDRDTIGADRDGHVEIDETWIGGATRGQGSGNHDQTLVICAVEVKQRKEEKKNARHGGRMAGRLRLEVVPNRGAKALCEFVEGVVYPGAMIVTDNWTGYKSLAARGFQHLPVAERGNPEVAEQYLPMVHLVFSNLKGWLRGVHHGVSPQHLQAYLNEFTFRFNRRFYPHNAFRSLLGIGSEVSAPTYDELYQHKWQHPAIGGVHG